MCNETKFIYLKNHPVFCCIEDELLLKLCNKVKLISVSRGELIDYGFGDYAKIYFVVKGKIKLSEVNKDGDELIKDIIAEGDFFGDLSFVNTQNTEEYAEALTPNTILCSFFISDFLDIMKMTPTLAVTYVLKIGKKLKKMEGKHADLVFLDARERLIRFIKHWAIADGSKVGGKIVLKNYLTHSDIAGFISTSRQSVNYLLNELRESGVLHYNRKTIELNDSFIWN